MMIEEPCSLGCLLKRGLVRKLMWTLLFLRWDVAMGCEKLKCLLALKEREMEDDEEQYGQLAAVIVIVAEEGEEEPEP